MLLSVCWDSLFFWVVIGDVCYDNCMTARCCIICQSVNYRGSIGFGQGSIDALLGNIGTMDVLDVQVFRALI